MIRKLLQGVPIIIKKLQWQPKQMTQFDMLKYNKQYIQIDKT